MNPSEQQIDVTDSTPVKCEVCSHEGPRWMMMTFRTGKFVMGGNMWGIADGIFCGICVQQREKEMIEKGIFTGKIVKEISWSEFKVPHKTGDILFEENGKFIWRGPVRESFAGTREIAERIRHATR